MNENKTIAIVCKHYLPCGDCEKSGKRCERGVMMIIADDACMVGGNAEPCMIADPDRLTEAERAFLKGL